jgi:hypothetical protein
MESIVGKRVQTRDGYKGVVQIQNNDKMEYVIQWDDDPSGSQLEVVAMGDVELIAPDSSGTPDPAPEPKRDIGLGVPCTYSFACPNEAVTTIHMGVIGAVDCCRTCADFYIRIGGTDPEMGN